MHRNETFGNHGMPSKLQQITYPCKTIPTFLSNIWIPTLRIFERNKVPNTWKLQSKYLIVRDESTNIQKTHCNRTSVNICWRNTNIHNHECGKLTPNHSQLWFHLHSPIWYPHINYPVYMHRSAIHKFPIST